MTALKKLRESRGITLKKASEESGIHLTTLFNIESGRCGLTVEKAEALAEYYSVAVEDLFAIKTYHPK